MPRNKPVGKQTFVCQKCGKETERNAINQRYCPDCREIADKERQQRRTQKVRMLRTGSAENICQDCGIEIPTRRKYCDACRDRHRKLADERAYKNARIRNGLSVVKRTTCEVCGKPLEPPIRGNRRYCNDCRIAIVNGNPHYKAIKEHEHKPKPALTIRQVNDYAKAHQMDYGAVSLLKLQGKLTDNDIKEWLKQCQKQCG